MRLIVLVLANYLLILASIVAFAAPFYWLFRKLHPTEPGKPAIGREVEAFFQSRQANWLVFLWAFGEALVWFVIPEFLLLLMIFMRVRRRRELLFYDIYGTAAGAIVAYCIDLPASSIHRLPYIQSKMVVQTQVWYREHGVWALIYQPFSGVPYKVFTFLAPHYHFFIVAYLAVAIIVRVARYYIFFAMFSLTYPVLHRYVYRRYALLFLAAVFVFSVLLLRVYESYGPHGGRPAAVGQVSPPPALQLVADGKPIR